MSRKIYINIVNDVTTVKVTDNDKVTFEVSVGENRQLQLDEKNNRIIVLPHPNETKLNNFKMPWNQIETKFGTNNIKELYDKLIELKSFKKGVGGDLEEVTKAIQKQTFLRVESIEDLKASTITEIGDKIAVKFPAKNNTSEFFNYERVVDTGQTDNSPLIIKGNNGEVYQLIDTDRVTPFMFGAKEQDETTTDRLQEFFLFIENHDYIGDFRGIWTINNTITIKGIRKEFYCGEINANNFVDILVKEECNLTNFKGEFIIRTEKVFFNSRNANIGLDLSNSLGRNKYEFLNISNTRKYAIYADVSQDNTKSVIHNIFENIKIYGCGGAGTKVNGSFTFKANIVDIVNDDSSIYKKSIIELDEINDILYKNNLVLIDNKPYYIDDYDEQNKKITVFPQVEDTFRGVAYSIHDSIYFAGGNANDVTIGNLAMQASGGVRFAAINGLNVNNIISEENGYTLAIGKRYTDIVYGVSINNFYSESTDVDLIEILANENINSVKINSSSSLYLNKVFNLYSGIISTVIRYKQAIYDSFNDGLKKGNVKKATINISNSPDKNEKIILNEGYYQNVYVSFDETSYLKFGYQSFKINFIQDNNIVWGLNRGTDIKISLSQSDKDKGFKMNNSLEDIYIQIPRNGSIIVYGIFDFINKNWVVRIKNIKSNYEIIYNEQYTNNTSGSDSLSGDNLISFNKSINNDYINNVLKPIKYTDNYFDKFYNGVWEFYIEKNVYGTGITYLKLLDENDNLLYESPKTIVKADENVNLKHKAFINFGNAGTKVKLIVNTENEVAEGLGKPLNSGSDEIYTRISIRKIGLN